MTVASSSIYYAAGYLLRDLGIVPDDDRVNLFVAWTIEEHGWTSNLSCHNPMNTTLPMPGSYSINSVHVQCYGTWDEGIKANIDTLEHGYPTLLEAVKEGSIDLFVSAEHEWLLWSGGNYSYGALIRDIFHLLPPVPVEYRYFWSTKPMPSGTGQGYHGLPLHFPSDAPIQRNKEGHDLIYWANQMYNTIYGIQQVLTYKS